MAFDYKEFMVTAAPTLPACTASHAALKAAPALWASLQLIGIQHIPADETGPAETLELRNCSCGSTLAVSVTL